MHEAKKQPEEAMERKLEDQGSWALPRSDSFSMEKKTQFQGIGSVDDRQAVGHREVALCLCWGSLGVIMWMQLNQDTRFSLQGCLSSLQG